MLKEKSCSFCGKTHKEASLLISGPPVYICNHCVDAMSSQIHKEERDQDFRLREEIEKTVTESFRKMVTKLDFGPLNEKYQRLMKVKFKEGPDSPTFPEVFAEFKRGVEEEIPAGDYQTRYDLAIAYSEMGLKEDAFREMMLALRYALLNSDYERAGEIMSALLIVHFDSARVIQTIKKLFQEIPG